MTKCYIYLTTFPKGEVYCGKHYDDGKPYIGSGSYPSKFKEENPDWPQMLTDGLIHHEVLEVCTPETLNQKEIEWIAAVRRVYGERCMNIADGGDVDYTELWKNPRFVQVQYKAMMKLWEDLNFRERHSQGARNSVLKLWQDPEFRQHQGEVVRDMFIQFQKDPEFRAKSVAALRKAHRYQNPETGEIKELTPANAGRNYKGWVKIEEAEA